MTYHSTRRALRAAAAAIVPLTVAAAPAVAHAGTGALRAFTPSRGTALAAVAMLAGLVAVAALVRRFAPDGKRRIRATAIAYAMYLGTHALGALFAWVGWSARASEIGWVGELLGTLVIINLTTIAFFDLALKLVRVRPSTLVTDLALGFGYLIALFHGLHTAGLNLSSIVATSAVVSAVIGLSLAPTLGNVVGGIALQLDNSVSEGDWIQLDAKTVGRVKAVRWRSTEIETRDWDTIVVPNSTLLSANITLLGKREAQPTQKRYWVYFNVDFRHSPAEVIAAVNEALATSPIPNVARTPAPHCICVDFAKDGRDSFGYYAVRYWLTDLAVDDPTNSAIRERIYAALNRAGIALAQPSARVTIVNDDEGRRDRKAQEDHSRRVELLGRLDLFNDFTGEELDRIARGLKYAPFAKGEAMTCQGREAHWLYILAEGEADVTVSVNGGPSDRVNGLRAPDFFGEQGAMTGEPRGATVVAKTPCVCYRLDREVFKEILTARKELAAMVSTVIVRRRDELKLVRENLDATQREARIEHESGRLVERIQSFFGLN